MKLAYLLYNLTRLGLLACDDVDFGPVTETSRPVHRGTRAVRRLVVRAIFGVEPGPRPVVLPIDTPDGVNVIFPGN